jgi:tRNA(Ile)-lysidine synthase
LYVAADAADEPGPDGDSFCATVAPALLDARQFAALMALLEPFEHRPRIAVAVSGGADSMALTLLAQAWVGERQGELLALTVDHGLREGSAEEAAQVGRWLAARGIVHRVLAWHGAKPANGVQEAARTARYALLLGHCREQGILHLLVAHHLNDQAETVLMRVAKQSGPDGLAAMAPIVPTRSARLLRPLLAVPRARLEATLKALDQPWIEDPTNRNPAFHRARLRQSMAERAGNGVDATELAGTARAMGLSRTVRDAEVAALLAEVALVAPAGFARIDSVRLMRAPEVAAMRALDRLIRMVGGGIYPMGKDRLRRLWSDLSSGLDSRRSLGGCLLCPGRGSLLLVREPARMAGPLPCVAGQIIHWDSRFLVSVEGRGTGHVGALGRDGWLAIKDQVTRPNIPNVVVDSLPALSDAAGLAAVPHLRWARGWAIGRQPELRVGEAIFSPASPLTGGMWNR